MNFKDEGIYCCKSCGAEVVVPIELNAGVKQQFSHECPECADPVLVHVHLEESGDVQVWVTPPQSGC